MKITLNNDTADKLSKDPSIKAMIYCASEPISPFSKVDISFPHQVEIKINGDDVKANLRGLKNKVGSTRPADITSLLRRRAGYENSMAVTYALTNRVSLSLLLLAPALFCKARRSDICGLRGLRLHLARNFIWS